MISIPEQEAKGTVVGVGGRAVVWLLSLEKTERMSNETKAVANSIYWT